MVQVGVVKQQREVCKSRLDIEPREKNHDKVILFPDGLLGFPEVKQYVLRDMEGTAPFKSLKALDGSGLEFVVIDPREFRPSYKVAVTAGELRGLELGKLDDAVVLALVTIPVDPSHMTGNLRGPLLINEHRGLGKQIVLLSNEYSTDHLILEEMATNL